MYAGLTCEFDELALSGDEGAILGGDGRGRGGRVLGALENDSHW